jgi:hypothetical protein
LSVPSWIESIRHQQRSPRLQEKLLPFPSRWCTKNTHRCRSNKNRTTELAKKMRSTNLVQTDDIGVLEQLQCRDLPPYLHTYAGDGEETNSISQSRNGRRWSRSRTWSWIRRARIMARVLDLPKNALPGASGMAQLLAGVAWILTGTAPSQPAAVDLGRRLHAVRARRG